MKGVVRGTAVRNGRASKKVASKAIRVLPEDCRIEKCEAFTFLRELRANSVDLALTDPPYTISRKTGFANAKNGVERFAVSMDFGKWDREQIDLKALAENLYRVLRQGGTAIVWYDIWKLSHLAEAMAAAKFRMLRLLFWEKTNPVPLNMKATYLSNSREAAIVGVKGSKPTFHGEYHNGVYGEYHNGVYRLPIPRHNGHRVHPTQKPLDLFIELVETHSKKGDFVVDPFLGSGTTAVASVRTGRRFAGCDIDPTYVSSAKKRVRNG